MTTKEHNMDRRQPDKRWHFRKEIHAGHIITTGMLIFGALSAYFDLDKRIDQGKEKDAYQDKRFEQHLSTTNHALTDIKKDVRDIRNSVIGRNGKN